MQIPAKIVPFVNGAEHNFYETDLRSYLKKTRISSSEVARLSKLVRAASKILGI
jgi:hypothetical protein